MLKNVKQRILQEQEQARFSVSLKKLNSQTLSAKLSTSTRNFKLIATLKLKCPLLQARLISYTCTKSMNITCQIFSTLTLQKPIVLAAEIENCSTISIMVHKERNDDKYKET